MLFPEIRNKLNNKHIMEYIINSFKFKYKTKLRYWIQKNKYDAVAHPYKIIYVEPSSIKYWVETVPREKGLGQIKSGDWELKPISEMEEYVGLRQRFIQGYDWEDTLYVKKVQEQIYKNGTKNGYECITTFIEERCRYIDNIFEDMKKNGYRPNIGLEVDFPEMDKRYKKYDQRLEPLVAIGQSGEIYWRDGFHRRALSEFLDLTIPVHVVLRHEKWQKVREESMKSKNQTGNVSHELHPDLLDIVNERQQIWKPK